MPAVCTTNCSYIFTTYSEITSLSLTAGKLNLALSDPLAKNFPLTTIKIVVEGQVCTIDDTSTLSALVCTLALNAANSPLIVAGQLTPLVYIKDFGIVKLAIGVSPVTVNLATTLLTKTKGGNNGGY